MWMVPGLEWGGLGMVVVAGHAVAGDAELARWVDAGADHAASLPPKAPKAPKARKKA